MQTTSNAHNKSGTLSDRGVALLWDESFLWGLMAYKALQSACLPFELIRAEDIRNGALARHTVLFVPGGWASKKLKSLGEEGVSEIRKFVEGGGGYLGFCGGAGLATLDGIGLLKVKRKPTKERVPSFSGRIKLNLTQHPVWNGLDENSSRIFQAWWPSQFLPEDERIKVLATYGEALPDSYSSDLNVGDVEENGGWSELEKIYSINLDPGRLLNAPAVIEGYSGQGRVVLSLIHFDTPEDKNGAVVLRNLWNYFAVRKAGKRQFEKNSDSKLSDRNISASLLELESVVDGLISLGMRNFLWFWRTPMLLQWRRGIRGLEYCTLYIMMSEISKSIRSGSLEITQDKDQLAQLREDLNTLKELLLPFVDDAKRLLVMERLALQNGHITYERCDDPAIRQIRTELFSNSKSHGGLFKKLLDETDRLLFGLITKQ